MTLVHAYPRILMFLVLAAAAGISAAQPTSLFGIEMRSPLKIEECPAKLRPDYVRKNNPAVQFDYDSFARGDTKPCFERKQDVLVGSKMPLHDEIVSVAWPWRTRPAMVGAKEVEVGLLRGAVHSIKLQTGGIPEQYRDLSLLYEKFGRPTEYGVNEVKSKYGTKHQSVDAGWARSSEIWVFFFGSMNHVDGGMLSAVTAEWQAKQAAEAKDAERVRQPL